MPTSSRVDRRNRAVVTASLAAIGVLGVVAAYQLQWLRRLPEVPLPGFASNELHRSAMAYPFGIPDALPGAASYVLTASLAATAAKPGRPAETLLEMKVIADVVIGLLLAGRGVFEKKAVSIYSIAVLGLSAFSLSRLLSKSSRTEI